MNKEDQFTEIIGIKELEVTHIMVYPDRYELSVCSILAEGICPECGKKCSFSTGKLEGTNNKLKLIKRRAFGFLNFEHFKARAMVEFY